MKLHAEFDCRMVKLSGGVECVGARAPRRRAVFATALAATLLLPTLGASPSTAAQARKPAQAWVLHADLLAQTAPTFSLAPAPRDLPLRVRDPRAYAAGKAAARRSYLARARRHASTRPRMAPQADAPRHSATAPSAALFEALNSPGMAAGGSFTEGTPPDTTGAIGPSDYIEMVNSQITVYSRALGLQATESEDEFTGGKSTCDGQIRWDQQGRRWEYASLNCAAPSTEQGFNFGWSKTADPTNLKTGWCKYHVNTEEFLVDYPKLGGDNDFLIIGANEFAMAKEEKYVGSSVVVIPKPAPGESSCTSSLALGVFAVPVFTPVPANLYGSSTTGYVVAAQTPETTGKELALFTVTRSPGGEPELKGRAVSVSSYSLPASVPQPGTTDGLDSSDTRLTQAVATEDPARHEMAIWTQHTVAATLGAPSVVRWYELTAGSSVPVQEGTIAASGGNFAFNGAISPTAAGNGAVIDYNVGGEGLTAQLRAQSRGSTTPAGEMRGEVKLAESEAIDHDFSCPSAKIFPSTSCRWGDYAGASPDPANIGVVWGGGQVTGPLPVAEFNAQWSTENFALNVHAPPTASFSIGGTAPTAAAPIGFDSSASSDPEGTIASYEWSFGDGTGATGEMPAHAYSRPGVYAVKLTVRDDAGFTAKTEQNVTVADAAPAASFAATTSSPTAGLPVSFDGSTSNDPDGTIASYEWSFGDGSSTKGGATPAHTYAEPGMYTVTLTVTDNGGKTASVSHVVTVAAAPLSLTVTDNGGFGASTEHTITVAQPSNEVRVIGVRQNKKTGSVALSILVPGSGSLSVRDAKASAKASRRNRQLVKSLIEPASSTISQAGAVTLQIVPTLAARTQLNYKHRLLVRALITFTPTGGVPGTAVRTLSLIVSARKKHK